MADKLTGPVASYPAGIDLSTTAKKATVVQLNSAGSLINSITIAGPSIGVLAAGNITGQECAVQIQGIAPVVLGGTLVNGAVVAAEVTSGKVITATTGMYPIGVIVKGGAENELGELLISTSTIAVA